MSNNLTYESLTSCQPCCLLYNAIDELEQFGLNVRLWRVRRRMTQTQLALEADTPANHISRIENGKQNVTLKMQLRLAAALGCTLADLLEGVDTAP